MGIYNWNHDNYIFRERVMGNIRSIDMMFLDDIFDMGSGYVLNFSDRTFAQFFAGELNIDIDAPVYAQTGGSKAKRLRCFLQTVDKPTVVRTLKALWEYREILRQRSEQEEKVKNAHSLLLALISRLDRPPNPRLKFRSRRRCPSAIWFMRCRRSPRARHLHCPIARRRGC